MYELPTNYSHPSLNIRNFLKTKKLELRARRKLQTASRLAPLDNENEKLSYSSLPSSPIKAYPPKLV